MCFRGCTCAPCTAQRETDRRYAGARKTSPLEFLSQQAASRRARRRGITLDQLLAMEEQRNSRCDICGKEETVIGAHGAVKSLSIDHDHKTGLVRGLLCNNCNRALGLFGDDAELLLMAVAYLKGSG